MNEYKISIIVIENQMTEKIDNAYYFGTEIKKIVLKSELIN